MALSACQTAPSGEPALLGASATDDLGAIRAQLATALSRGSVSLGPPDPRAEPVLSVLPPPASPLEGRSLAMPEVYDIETDGTGCRLVDRRSGEGVPLRGVPCRAAP